MAEMMNAKDFFGPLAALIGEWKGDKGMDIAPEPGGEEHSPYYETILIEPVGDATNAEEQTLGVLSYKQVVHRKVNGDVFHHQIGYWYFERKTGEILYSLMIPRAVAVLARGKATESGEKTNISVKADAADKNYGIIESAFM
ncbi:MAG TPA: heme-binding beta-barrel domain-containing protein, partial [Turneriella sp.]|nr:heme-binding beta-barrel domain-containing protein [Turneriella sp.]